MKRSAFVWAGGVMTLLSGVIALTTSLLWSATTTSVPTQPSRANDPDRSAAAFRQVAAVLRHPRCMNCHTATDFPRQGNERRRHDMLVLRGADDHGAPAMRCSSCHQNTNQSNGVPGAPNWGLAPLSMAWEGLNDHQLAESLKDPARNGRRSLQQLHEHMAHDELVGWAWQPGGTREPVPIPRNEFARLVREWIDTGAVSPPAP
jgi:hypothetical protein